MNLWPFKKKESKPATGIPTQRVTELASKGLSEPEIIKVLREEGYTPLQIDTAMKTALRNAAAVGKPIGPPSRAFPSEPPRPRPESQYPEPPRPPEPFFEEEIGMEGPESDELDKELPGFPEELPPRPDFLRPPEHVKPAIPEEEPVPKLPAGKRETKEEKRRMIEELVETIVDERWEEFSEKLNKFEAEYQELNKKISDLEQKINQIHLEKDDEMKEIEGKIDSYKQSLAEMSVKLESLERAMKDSLSPMLQTLRSLSDTIKLLKERK